MAGARSTCIRVAESKRRLGSSSARAALLPAELHSALTNWPMIGGGRSWPLSWQATC
jgi:hypothetical protein